MIQKRSLLAFTLLISGALALAGCPSDDDDDGMTDASPDTGVNDTGVTDSGTNDTGTNDTGTNDTGTNDTGVDTCLVNNTVDVAGTGVVVDEATAEPLTQGDTPAVLSCRAPPAPGFQNDYCLVECVDFLGYQPSRPEVEQLQIAVFPLFDFGSMTSFDIDPTYDRATGEDNDPASRLPIGFIFESPQNTDCASGWQLELAFTGNGPGGGDATLLAEFAYMLRVTTSSGANNPAWVDTYHYGFIRRNDEASNVGACGINEARIPGTRYTFPVVHRSILEDAISNAGSPIPGSADLDDGLGSGYAILESRDCSSGGGLAMENATLGLTPTPIADVYPGAAFELNRTALFTSGIGHWLAVGFEEMTATSSMALDVVGAVGVSSEGTCTEAFAGSEFPVYPDSVTFIRFNRENAIIQ
jgi:hypothetical protein